MVPHICHLYLFMYLSISAISGAVQRNLIVLLKIESLRLTWCNMYRGTCFVFFWISFCLPQKCPLIILIIVCTAVYTILTFLRCSELNSVLQVGRQPIPTAEPQLPFCEYLLNLFVFTVSPVRLMWCTRVCLTWSTPRTSRSSGGTFTGLWTPGRAQEHTQNLQQVCVQLSFSLIVSNAFNKQFTFERTLKRERHQASVQPAVAVQRGTNKCQRLFFLN